MSKEIVAVVDGGGRGHALIKQYARSDSVEKLLAFPGNDFMQVGSDKQVLTYPTIKTLDVAEIITTCKAEQVTLVDVAQDAAVAAGLVNALAKEGIATVGPTQDVGRIESDKIWAREFMQKQGIRQPEFISFTTIEAGIRYLKTRPDQSWFVKASGLAEGKGALPTGSNEEAIERIKELSRFGKSGEEYLLEEWIKGENNTLAQEFSAFALSDGTHFSLIGYAQDYKRAYNGNRGENTGGMGCITSPSFITPEIEVQVNDILTKTVEGLRKEGHAYKGVLYLGGMIDGNNDVYVVEYNARWGDPEAQILVPGIQNDFVEMARAVKHNKIHEMPIQVDGKSRVVVAGTAHGYPDAEMVQRAKGSRIHLLHEAMEMQGVSVYGAGIKKKDMYWVINGGRVFYIVGEGENIVQARDRAYVGMGRIEVDDDNLRYRSDIGSDEIERLTRLAVRD